MAPKYAVGDTWKFDTGWTGRVKEVHADGTVVFADSLGFIGGAIAYRWRDGAVEEVGTTNENIPGRLNAVLLGTGWQFLSFPLEVGKEWQSSGEGYIPGPDGGRGQRHVHFTVNCKVWSYEDVHTKAGTFKAFRMTIEWVGLTPGYRFSNVHVFWWAPEVKFMVKQRSNGWNWELASYRVRESGSGKADCKDGSIMSEGKKRGDEIEDCLSNLRLLQRWLDTWSGIGHVVAGMARQEYDLKLRRYGGQGWRAVFFQSGSSTRWTSHAGHAWARSP